MSSEHRAEVGVPGGRHDLSPVDAKILELGHRVSEAEAAGKAAGVEILDAVDLLGSVGQVKVDRECPYQAYGLHHIHIVEHLGQGCARLLVAPQAPAIVRTCSTRSSSSGPCWRTRASPSWLPSRRMSLRSAESISSRWSADAMNFKHLFYQGLI